MEPVYGVREGYAEHNRTPATAASPDPMAKVLSLIHIYGKITAKQQEILDYIKDEILKRGYPPTVREICETVNLKSTSSVHSHLETLEKNGYIRRDPTKPRAIEICDDNFQMVRTEMVSLPVIGNVAAGQPILAEENVQDYFPVPADVVPKGESFILNVRGESMINAGIFLSLIHIYLNSSKQS